MKNAIKILTPYKSKQLPDCTSIEIVNYKVVSDAVAQLVERITRGEVLGLIPAVAVSSLPVGQYNVTG